MELLRVINKVQSKEFLQVPKILYKNDKNWVCPLDVEIEGIFNPNSNICFQNGEAERWILKSDEGKLIGRIAAFIDRRKVDVYKQPTGAAGFFECINNQEAANLLFDIAREWLSSKGMEAMVAPVNFGENYNYQGVLIEGFVQQTYGMNYNFPYYSELYVSYGFKEYFGQSSFRKQLDKEISGRLVKFAEYIASRPEYSFEHLKFNNIDKYINDFAFTYNKIWSAFHDGYIPLKNEEIRKMLKEASMVIEEEFIWFAYDKGKPIGIMVAFPDVNQILKKLKNGKLNILNKLKFIYYKKRAVSRSRAFMFGILPEYQNKGVIASLFYQMIKILRNKPQYIEAEISWVGDYNPKMLSIFDKFGAKLAMKHSTYLCLFDTNAPFERFNNEFEGKLYN